MSRTTKNRTDVADAKIAGAAESESALRRWSRRKHEARATARGDSGKTDPAPAAKVEAPDPAPARVLTDADMPPIETLDEHSDFSPFMSPGVSEALRRAALRRLFRAPQFNELCELEGEYFDARGYRPLGNVVTYDMRDALERELAKAKEKAEEKIRAEFAAPEKSTSAAAPAHPAGEPERRGGAAAEAKIAGTSTGRGQSGVGKGDA